ncbi:MAG: hypothetical protein FJY09_06780 [Chlorobi bacterium]|nr:hypothetical protein [Chlorobiota bacterium]
MEDFGVIPLTGDNSIQALKIPAPLACYWLGESETTSALEVRKLPSNPILSQRPCQLRNLSLYFNITIIR